MKNKKAKRSSAKRVALSVLCVLLALVLTVLLGGTIFAKHLLSQVNRVSHDTQPTMSVEELNAFLQSEAAIEKEQAGEDATESTAPTVNAEDVVFEEHNTQIGGEDSDIINILLIGQDRRENETGRTRSDTMILCTFNKEAKTLTMTSFLRDLYVKIPGYYNTKINAAYAAGGMSLLNQTLEENFGIHVDGNVEVDFSGFEKIVDLLGGVQMELRDDEARYINRHVGSSLSGGMQTLSGAEALLYARIRYLDADADFSRTNRQRKVISSLIDSYKNSSLTEILSLLEDVLPMITTDLTDAEIIGYATELFPLLAETTIVSQRIPADGQYQFATIDSASVILADMNAARELLEETISGKSAE